MKTPARALRLIAACTVLTVFAGCGGSSTTTSISLSGTITGLTDVGLVLSNGTSSVALSANSTSFFLPTRVLIGSAYSVVPTALPATLTCTVNKGIGIAPSGDITDIQVACVPRHSLGGTITGLTTDGLTLANGSDTVAVARSAQSFTFPTQVGQGFSYGVTILKQPVPQTCSVVANNSGIMGMADINNVQVACK